MTGGEAVALAADLVKALSGPDTDTPARAVVSGVYEELTALASVFMAAQGYKWDLPTPSEIAVIIDGAARRLGVGLKMMGGDPGKHPIRAENAAHQVNERSPPENEDEDEDEDPGDGGGSAGPH